MESKLLFEVHTAFSITVRQNIRTGLSIGYWIYMAVLSDDTVVVGGNENNQYKLKCYSLETGQELRESTNINNVYGMTEVDQGGRSAVALSDQ